MKKVITRIGALCLASLILIGSTVKTEAKDRSYSYNYDYWGDVQDSPDLYSVSKVVTSKDLNLETTIRNPQGIYASGNNLYICDGGNNRIIKTVRTEDGLKVEKIIDSFYGNVDNKTFSMPSDIAISEEGNIFIADKGNSRILKLDKDYNYIMQFDAPVDSTVDNSIPYQPNKIVIDTAERVYCIATSINKGLIKYEADGTFSGFVGATPVKFDFTDYIWKKFATQEQLSRMVAFVPTEYSNIYMDQEGFVYAVTGNVSKEDLRGGDVQAVRKLNLLGNDILYRNGVYYDGDFPTYGDIYMGQGGSYSGPSFFADVTVFDNDSFICLDKNRGRMFCYDDQGKLIFASGGNGNMAGYFKNPVSIDHIGYEVYVLDQLNCSVTIFTLTEFGELVFSAMDYFDDGEYEKSLNAWEEVIVQNGNYDLAYIGIGRAYLRQKDYKTAMEYFELKYDDENYSKAYRQYRKIWVEEHIVAIVVIILLLFFVPMGIGRVKSIKHEFETADVFKYKK